MSLFHEWLIRLFHHGESVQTAPPVLGRGERAEILSVLHAAFDLHALDVSGSPVVFEGEAALGGAMTLAKACWRLVTSEEIAEPLNLPSEPTHASAHLCVDLTLRFLPAVYRRARAHAGTETLADELETLLRRWPLSGVLADLDGEPTTAPEFGGHSGLQLLYAERLLATGRPGWVPADGPARERVERVYQERGKVVPARLKEKPGD